MRIALSTTPSTAWTDQCVAAGALFHSPSWQALLEQSFDCTSLYLSDAMRQGGGVLTVFRAGPFKLAYLGFPVGGTVAGLPPLDEFVAGVAEAQKELGTVAVRIPVSAFEDSTPLRLPYVTTPETVITDLQSWALDQRSTNLRRNVRQGLQAELKIVEQADSHDASSLFSLYRQTVRRSRGALRYTESYFKHLVELAGESDRLRVLLAKKAEKIAAFIVVALHQSTAFYLHGARDPELRNLQAPALLMHEGIVWAQKEGCTSFNFMSSPPAQDSLVRYKERWGGETREHRTYTLVTSSAYPAFRLAEKLYRLMGG